MKKFYLVSIFDENTLKKMQKDRLLKQSVILPRFGESFVCFSVIEELSFEELTELFFNGDEGERIGAISVIAERFPKKLYDLIQNSPQRFSQKQMNFILCSVVSDYLPLLIPKERLLDFKFDSDYSQNVWVNILSLVRERLKKYGNEYGNDYENDYGNDYENDI